MNDMIRPALYQAYMNILEIDRTLQRVKKKSMSWSAQFAKLPISSANNANWLLLKGII